MSKPMYVWNGSTWEEVGPVVPQTPIAYQASAPVSPSTGDIWVDSDGDVGTFDRQLVRYRFVASGGETSLSGVDANGFTLAYVPGAEQVYLNGVLLVRTSDYTATNGTSITALSPALAANDVVEVFAYNSFNLANTYTQSQVDGLIGGTGTLSGAWTSYTPTLTNLTIGNGTITAKYKQIGKTVFVQIEITFGSTTSFSGGNVKITPPVAVNSSYSDYHALGVVSLLDLGTTIYSGVIYKESTNLVIEKLNVTGSNINFAALGTTSPMTWASGDKIQTVITYEAA